jgi:hypothetical protein
MGIAEFFKKDSAEADEISGLDIGRKHAMFRRYG